jgi:ABC-type branched-subunit amino acid transport system ATPase component
MPPPTDKQEPLLSVRGLTKRFGGLLAVDGVDFDLLPGEILGLIGPNGAGKTTVFNLISGAFAPSAGSITFAGERLDGLPVHRIAARGLMRTFQHNMPFVSLSLTENILIGRHARFSGSLIDILIGRRRLRQEEGDARRRAAELIAFVGLGDRADHDVATLSFGEGRLLEVARALAGDPRAVLLDEPAAGLTPDEMTRLAGVIRAIAARGIAVLLIEHDMHFLLTLAQRVVVLNFGRKIAQGTPLEITRNSEVVQAYLGEAASGIVPAPSHA